MRFFIVPLAALFLWHCNVEPVTDSGTPPDTADVHDSLPGRWRSSEFPLFDLPQALPHSLFFEAAFTADVPGLAAGAPVIVYLRNGIDGAWYRPDGMLFFVKQGEVTVELTNAALDDTDTDTELKILWWDDAVVDSTGPAATATNPEFRLAKFLPANKLPSWRAASGPNSSRKGLSGVSRKSST